MGDLDLPFEEVPGGPVSVPLSAFVAVGVVVRAAIAGTDQGQMPCLVFDFHLADGSVLPPVTLVQTPQQMGDLSRLIEQATTTLIKRLS